MKKLLCVVALMCLASVGQAKGFTIATGDVDGGYNRTGKLIASYIETQARKTKGVSMRADTQPSNGSIENLELLNSGEVQGIMVQADALYLNPPSVPVGIKTAYPEYVFWIYNKKLAIEDFGDLEGNEEMKIAVVDNSGTVVTLNAFAKADDGYQWQADNYLIADDLYDAADMVSEGRSGKSKVVGMLYVGKRIPSEIAEDFSRTLAIGEVNDLQFNNPVGQDGEPIYVECSIEAGNTSGMTTASWGKPDTLCVNSQFVYVKSDKKVDKLIKKAVTKALRNL